VFDCMCNTQNSLLLNQHNGDVAPQECRVFESMLLRGIFGTKNVDVVEERGKKNNTGRI